MNGQRKKNAILDDDEVVDFDDFDLGSLEN